MPPLHMGTSLSTGFPTRFFADVPGKAVGYGLIAWTPVPMCETQENSGLLAADQPSSSHCCHSVSDPKDGGSLLLPLPLFK